MYFLGPYHILERAAGADREPHPSHRTGPPRGVRPDPSTPTFPAGRRSRENEAQHSGGRLQEELAVGTPSHGGGVHQHPAVSEGTGEAGPGLCPCGPVGFPGPLEVKGKQWRHKKLSHWFKVEEETGRLGAPHPDLWVMDTKIGRDQAGNKEQSGPGVGR